MRNDRCYRKKQKSCSKRNINPKSCRRLFYFKAFLTHDGFTSRHLCKIHFRLNQSCRFPIAEKSITRTNVSKRWKTNKLCISWSRIGGAGTNLSVAILIFCLDLWDIAPTLSVQSYEKKRANMKRPDMNPQLQVTLFAHERSLADPQKAALKKLKDKLKRSPF